MPRHRGSTIPNENRKTSFENESIDDNEDTSSTLTTIVYVKRCKAFKMVPDPSVLACLETSWHVMAITPSRFSEGALLPLLEVLAGNSCAHVRELRMVPAPILRASRQQTFSGDIDARCLNKIFSTNKTIVELDLSHIGLGPKGIEEISSILRLNKTLQKLRLCNNPGGRLAYKSLASGLQHNKSLLLLDISSNRLGFDVFQLLRKVGKRERPALDLQVLGHGNNVVEEALNTLTHGMGFVTALFGVVALLWHATASLRVWWSCLVYGCTLLLMYACSTVFHASFDSALESYDFWKMCDHSSIFFLIAGSTTPFLIVALPDSNTAIFVFLFQWGCALFGIGFGVYATHHQIKHKLKAEMTLNFLQGFIVLLVFDDLKQALGQDIVNTLLASATCYVLGAVFFVAEHTVHPIAHAIWHLFVIGGSTIHYFAVLQFVMELEKQERTAGDTLSQVVCRIVSSDLPVLTSTIKETLMTTNS